MLLTRIGLIITLVVGTAVVALAQDNADEGGQFWVRAFEDLNGDGTRDEGEPLLTRGISVNLLDASGIIIASALLDSSPSADRGLVGFTFLPPGTYSITVTSADFESTTPASFTQAITADGQPLVVEFGGQAISALPEPEAEATPQVFTLEELRQMPPEEILRQFDVMQIGAAAGGSLIVMLAMAFLGLIISALAFRGQRADKRRQTQDVRSTTGSMRPVNIETGEFRRK